jgi:hypothetical protein
MANEKNQRTIVYHSLIAETKRGTDILLVSAAVAVNRQRR